MNTVISQNTVTSRDGTRIAYERAGRGPAVILVDGAMCHRAMGPNPALARELAATHTVYTYDRRGRGGSGDTPPYAPEREVEDIAALAEAAGEPVFLYGISSGAALALAAAGSGLPVRAVAVYEPPFVVDDTRPPIPADYRERLESLLAEGKPGAAVRYFMRAGVGLPAVVVAMMRLMPAWSKMLATAPTLPYDAAFVARFGRGEPLPRGEWDTVTVPALVVDGGKSPAWIRNGTRNLAEVLPGARYRTLDGQTHQVKAEALAPVLRDFFQ